MAEQRQEGFGDRDGAEQVGRERCLEHLRVGEVVLGGVGGFGQHAGVVYQDVEATVPLLDLLDRGGDARGNFDVQA